MVPSPMSWARSLSPVSIVQQEYPQSMHKEPWGIAVPVENPVNPKSP